MKTKEIDIREIKPLRRLSQRLSLFEAVIPDEFLMLQVGKVYNFYHIHDRLYLIGKWHGDEWQLMRLLIDSDRYHVFRGTIKRLY